MNCYMLSFAWGLMCAFFLAPTFHWTGGQGIAASVIGAVVITFLTMRD